MRLALHLTLAAAVALSQSACSVFSPLPLWELTKATGTAVGAAISVAPTQASNTVYHAHAPFKSLCIELNTSAPIADLVPALQLELQGHGIDSRVYEMQVPLDACAVWLKYSAQIEWDVPPFGERHRATIVAAALTLQSAEGRVLSASSYELDPVFGMGKWAPTRAKLAPVVTALLTGIENRPPTLPKDDDERAP